MKIVIGILAGLFLLLQYQLWAGSGGFGDVWRHRQAVALQQAENAQLLERNQALEAEVTDLKQGLEALEELARSELGMIKKNETFFQVIGP